MLAEAFGRSYRRPVDSERRIGGADLAQKLIIDLRNRYVLSCMQKDSACDGKYHSIKVQSPPPKGI